MPRRLLLVALILLPGCNALFGDFPHDTPPAPPAGADAAKVAESFASGTGAASTPSAGDVERRAAIAALRQENEMLTRRLRAVESETAALRRSLEREAAQRRALAAAAATPPPTPSPSEAYAAALGAFRAYRYDDALRGFSGFLERFPRHPLALNAQYWIGECRYGKRDFPQAIVEFEHVLALPANARKAPDALLMIAQSYRALHEAREADAALRRLVREYPRSSAAALARRFLRPTAP